MKVCRKEVPFFFVGLVVLMIAPNVIAETLYVNSKTGNDANPGTKEKPLRTIGQAASVVNGRTEPGPTTIKIEPGVYNFTEAVVFENTRPYTEKDRLIIEASVLPDEPQWRPALMPVILSTEDPRKQENLNAHTGTYGLQIKISYVTIRGLKFLGNPLPNNWYNPVSRIGTNLEDFIVTQCLFVGDKDALDIYCATLATGNGFVLDHNIFYNCHACVVFWDGTEGIGGKGNAMRYCIVDGAYISGVWTCQTAGDFEFHHNIVTRSEYLWMRKSGDQIKYRLHDCIVTDNRYYSGYGVESGPTDQTGPEVTYEEKNVVKDGKVILEKNKSERNYLHVVDDTLGSELGAGLFKK
jgi:hypothetical protein